MIKINDDNTVTVENGTGYWDLSFYPWGGDFHRFTADVRLPIDQIITKYNDGSPKQLIAIYNNKKVGLKI